MDEAYAALRCPETKQELAVLSLSEAKAKINGTLLPLRTVCATTQASPVMPIGATEKVLLRTDLRRAYPVVEDIPVLLVPEMLGEEGQQRDIDLGNVKYAEAYAEMESYNKVAIEESKSIERSESYKVIEPLIKTSRDHENSFPSHRKNWIDAVYDCAGQWDAYNHMTPLQGKRILQLGGKGIHAVKFLLAGASSAWVASPIVGELLCARRLASVAGVSDRLYCVAAIAEETPFMDEFFDLIYSGGCFHHMEAALALPEISRILKNGGSFCAVDPWLTPVYGFGKRVFGQRESAHCHPLTNKRIELLGKFFKDYRVIHHGALFRYPMLLLDKFGFSTPISMAWPISKVDDFVADLLPGFRNVMGGSVSLLCKK